MPAMTSALSAICGTHLGLTKQGDPNLFQARLLQALHQLDFDGRRHGLELFCSPSRGPTSMRRTLGDNYATTPVQKA